MASVRKRDVALACEGCGHERLARSRAQPGRAHIRLMRSHCLQELQGPQILARFYLPLPKAVKRLLSSVKPDLDKLMRALGDGMTDSGLLVDDSLIVTQWLHKRYAIEVNPVGVRVLVMKTGEAR